MAEKVTLLPEIDSRPATEKDIDFLYSLHVATMKEYVDQVWGWDDVHQESLFRRNYDPAMIRIVIYDGKDIGMLSTEERETDVFLRTLEIHPEFQGKGIGTAILRRMIADSAQRKKPVFLQVLRVNPAKELYERLGFATVEETETHYKMRTTISE